MPYIPAVIEIDDENGNRLDLPVKGVQQPIVLVLDSSSLDVSSSDRGDGTTAVRVAAKSQTGSYATTAALNAEVSRAEGAEATLQAEINSMLIERTPVELAFSEVMNDRSKAWFDGATLSRLQPTGLLWVNDPFTDSTTGRFTTLSEATPGTIAISGGQLTISQTSGGARQNMEYEGAAIRVPQVCIAVDIVSKSGTAGAYFAALVGIVKDANNYICVNFDTANNNANIQYKIGASTSFSANSSVTYSAGMSIIITFVGNWVNFYKSVSGVITKIAGYDLTSKIDLKAEDLTAWFPFFGLSNPGTNANSMVFDNFKVGRCGGVGTRDWTLVTNPDGTPYLVGSTAYFTGTLAGASGGIPEASCGIFSMDLESKVITQLGVLLNSRGGKIQNDHAAHIVKDGANQRVLISTWGDNATAYPQVQYQNIPVATQDLLAAGLTYTMAGSTLTLDAYAGIVGRYDPYLIKNGATWYLAYVATTGVGYNFYPALATSSDLATWAATLSDASALRFEGTKITFLGGSYYVIAGGQYGCRVYDLTMTFKGWLGGVSPGDGTTQPHPQLVPYKTQVLWVTFDQTLFPAGTGAAFSWGALRTLSSPRY